MSPTVAIGLGLTKASAARKPGLADSSAGVTDGFEEIDGVDRLCLRLDGETAGRIVLDGLEDIPSCLFTDSVDAFAEGSRSGPSGKGLSSIEYIDKSSQFQ
jgi:hypothetical protein